MKVLTRADQLLSQLLMETFDTLTSQYRHIRDICMKKLNAKKNYIIFRRFDGLCSLTSFTLLTITVRRVRTHVSNNHWLLPFLIFLTNTDMSGTGNTQEAMAPP